MDKALVVISITLAAIAAVWLITSAAQAIPQGYEFPDDDGFGQQDRKCTQQEIEYAVEYCYQLGGYLLSGSCTAKGEKEDLDFKCVWVYENPCWFEYSGYIPDCLWV